MQGLRCLGCMNQLHREKEKRREEWWKNVFVRLILRIASRKNENHGYKPYHPSCHIFLIEICKYIVPKKHLKRQYLYVYNR